MRIYTKKLTEKGLNIKASLNTETPQTLDQQLNNETTNIIYDLDDLEGLGDTFMDDFDVELSNKIAEYGFNEDEILSISNVTQKIKQASIIKNILSEFLDNFIIMGYDLNGVRTVIKNATTHKDEDSIIELVKYTLYSILKGDE